MKIANRADGCDIRTDAGMVVAQVRQIQVEGSWWWAALKPNRETISPEGRSSRAAALRDALEYAAHEQR